jgi:hypothetical protein
MNWLKTKIRRWLDSEQDCYATPMAISKSGNRIDSPRGGRMSFNVYKAQGGHVIEFTTYDERTDNHSHSLHLINDNDDFSETLGKIVFMETLKR